MSRLRVVQLGKFYPPFRGGMETYLQHLSQVLDRHVDLEVLVANTRYETVRERIDGVRVARLASLGRVRSTSIVPSLPAALRRSGAEVVHVHAPNPMAEVALLGSSLATRARVVVTWHADVVRQRWLGRLYRPVSRRLLARADAICVATPVHVDASPLLRPHAAKCHVCPFGIDIDATVASPDAVAAIRSRWGGRPIVLGVGRLVYYKGFDVLLDAVRDLGVTLLLVGEGERRAALEARIAAHGLADRAVLLGEQRDLAPFFAACDVFVLPSTERAEAFGIVQLEAMAAGKPVVSTRLGTGVDWVNVDGTTGVTVPPGDAAALRAALARLLADPQLRTRLGTAGRRRVEERFTTAQAGAAVLAVYERITGRRLLPLEDAGVRRVA